MARKKSSDNDQQPQIPQMQSQSESYADDWHGTLITWINEADDATLSARDLAEKSRRYYDSEQWTEDEAAKLRKQKQAPTVINRIKPKMDGLMGMERVNRTTAKAYPRTPKHQAGATAATEAIRYVLQNNSYTDTRSACWDNICIEGTCGAEVVVSANEAQLMKGGDEFRITIRHLMWDRLVYDPYARRKDFSDARYLGQVVWMDYDEAAAMYPDATDALENTIGSNSTTYDDKPRWADNTRNRVKIVELYYRKDGDVHYACFTRGGYVKRPRKSPYINEEGQTEWPYEFASTFVTREGVRYGAVRQLIDIQDEINKRRSKALHLMSVRQVRWERGAVEDINKTRAELAKPDGVIETTPGMEFEILKTGDMATAQFNLLTEAKEEIDAVSYSAAAAGKEARSMSGVALRSREMASQTELAPMFDVLRGLDIRIYRKVWNRVKQYWTAEKWIRVTDDENNLRFVGLNKPMTAGEELLRKAQEQGLPPEQLQVLQQRIATDPSMQAIVGTENDIAELDVDIIMDEAPDAVTTQAEDFVVLGEMVKSGFQMPAEAVILASPLSNKDKIIKMMREQQQAAIPPQVQAQMQQLQEDAMKMAEENKALKEGIAEHQAQMAADERKAVAELEMKARIAARELEIKRDTAMAELALKKEIAAEEARLDAEKANREHRLAMDDQAFAQMMEKMDAMMKAVTAMAPAQSAVQQ